MALSLGCSAEQGAGAADVATPAITAVTEVAQTAQVAQLEQSAPQPCGLALAPIDELREATNIVAARWSAATGCDVRVEEGGLPVRFATAEELDMGEGRNARGVTSLGADGEPEFIGYRTGPVLSWTAETTLAHELGHALGCHAHTTDSSVLDTPAPLYSEITSDALDCVCASLACNSYQPE